MSQVPEVLPPILRDWVEKLNDPSFNSSARENYYGNLKSIAKFVEDELKKYDNARLKNAAFKQAKKK